MTHELTKQIKLRLLIAFLLIFIILSGIFSFFEIRNYYQRHENCLYAAANQAKLIEGSLNTVMSRVYTLRSLLKTNDGDTSFFDLSVPELYNETVEDTGLYVKNFILAPNGIVENVYPLKDNEDLIGLNYMDQTLAGNTEAIKAYKEDKLVLTDPFTLKQGGTGLAGRLPVHITQNGQDVFWGMVAVTLDMDYLLNQFNLSYLIDSGYDYCLWYTNASGEKVILDSSSKMPKNPVSYQMNPGNLNWTLDIAPKRGWISVLEISIGIVVILLISLLFLWILHTRAKMRMMNSILEQIAIKDNLTNCYSRHFVNVMLLAPGTNNWKDSNACYSLAIVDVDRFKSINDTYGHNVGDQALVAIAQTLQNLCDEMRGDCVIRYGGDEFIFLMNNINRELFESRLQSMVNNVREIRIQDAPDMRLSISVGAVMSTKDETYYELFARADKQVYLSKENGKDQYHLEATPIA